MGVSGAQFEHEAARGLVSQGTPLPRHRGPGERENTTQRRIDEGKIVHGVALKTDKQLSAIFIQHLSCAIPPSVCFPFEKSLASFLHRSWHDDVDASDSETPRTDT